LRPWEQASWRRHRSPLTAPGASTRCEDHIGDQLRRWPGRSAFAMLAPEATGGVRQRLDRRGQPAAAGPELSRHRRAGPAELPDLEPDPGPLQPSPGPLQPSVGRAPGPVDTAGDHQRANARQVEFAAGADLASRGLVIGPGGRCSARPGSSSTAPSSAGASGQVARRTKACPQRGHSQMRAAARVTQAHPAADERGMLAPEGRAAAVADVCATRSRLRRRRSREPEGAGQAEAAAGGRTGERRAPIRSRGVCARGCTARRWRRARRSSS
jgi:hypothetical protein